MLIFSNELNSNVYVGGRGKLAMRSIHEAFHKDCFKPSVKFLKEKYHFA